MIVLKCLVGRDSLHLRDIDFLTAKPCDGCLNPQKCGDELQIYKDDTNQYLDTFSSPLLDFVIVGDVELCRPCKTSFKAGHAKKRKEVWAALPKLFKLEDLEWPAASQQGGVVEGGG